MNNNKYYEQDGCLYIGDDCTYINLVMTDARNNNNKFYEMKMLPDGSVTATYGRVGASGTTVNVGHGIVIMRRKAHEKYRKGYLPFYGANKDDSGQSIANSINLVDVAIKDMIPKKTTKTNHEILTQLITLLVKQNQHQIANFSGGQVTIDDSGLVKTAVGVVSMESVQKARAILLDIQKIITKGQSTESSEYIDLINQYLMLIPQKVPSSRGWHSGFFKVTTTFEKQFDFLDQLEASIARYNDLIKLEKEKSDDDRKASKSKKKVFNTKISVVEDENILKHIQEFFKRSSNSSHSSSKLKLKRVYAIQQSLPTNKKFDEYVKSKGNVQEYWHGTRVFNILSILQNGLVIPKSNSFNVTGRMFGDGVYFSDQSTKSLNYSYGYWSNSKDNHCFMFLADVVMGKTFLASHKQAKEDLANKKIKAPVYPVKGYDSVIATGGVKNVIHDGSIASLSNAEMIVFDLNQIKIQYLCEFTD